MKPAFMPALALVAASLLSGCMARNARPEALPTLAGAAAIAAAGSAQAERVAWLDARPRWSLEGRIAISNAGKGGSGRIDWQQQGDVYTVSLSAPVTRQSWRMSGSRDGALLEGVQGGPRQGEDAALLLLEATGWEIPVEALADWARGKASGLSTGLDVAYAADARLQKIRQGGWEIDYLHWQPADGDRPALPARIEARRGDAKVRLIIDSWDFPAQ